MFDSHRHQLAVRFLPGISRGQRERALAHCCLLPFPHREIIPGDEWAVFPLAEANASPGHRRAVLEALQRHRHVAHAAAVFRRGRHRWFAAHRLAIRPGPGGGGLIRQLHKKGAVVTEEAHGHLLVELGVRQTVESVLADLGRYRSIGYVEPDLIRLASLQGGQARNGGMALSQRPFQLIDAATGWRLGVASSDIVIAVLDGGVMIRHPDLKAAVATSYDATTGRRNQTPKPWDAHGTSCAGLAVGVHAGAAGVKGVAAGCRLMAIRVGSTPTRLASYITKNSWLQRGIDWAWEHGASVLSMSFGGGPRSALVADALTRARTKGRDGLGAVLVAAAGNGDAPDTPVEFPATLAGVVAVGATDNQDRPKNRLTNTEPWISASGAAVDIAAPGVGCYTATVPDPTEGDTSLYTDDFSGTSAATPLVAAAAALVLSANPRLTERQVRQLLGATADRVRTVRYRSGHNDLVGSGRLNVGAAVRAALLSSGS